ncbi:MAG TPA: hypothetical protein VNH63_12645 [Gemmatimonadales bacterium]|nr:hypothetical protein [Gemmatimonadales bacterium]
MRVVSGAWLAAVLAATPAAAQTSLSIYSDGRVVVRKTLPQPLQKGSNVLTLRLDNLDPATLFSPDSSVTVVSVVTRLPTDRGAALQRAVGQTLSFVRAKGDTVRATVVSVNPPQYKLTDGRVLLSEPGEPLFPAEQIREATEASIVLDATRGRPRTDLAYVTSGATWEATYQAVLGKTALVSGGATITPGAFHAESVGVQVVAGSINQARSKQYAPPMALRAGVMAQADMVGTQESVGEAHVYELPGRLTLEAGVPLTVALFPRASAPYVVEYVVPGVLPWRGYFGPQPTDPTAVPVQVWYTFKRARGSAFGDRPLPGGTVQLYQADSAGRVQLIGEAAIGHTPAGKDVRVQSGDAFDVTAERVQTDYNQEQIPPAKRGLPMRQRVTASYRVTLSNAKPDSVTVDVRETHFGTWQITESSVPGEKLSSSETRFRVRVPANGTATLTYTVQVES